VTVRRSRLPCQSNIKSRGWMDPRLRGDGSIAEKEMVMNLNGSVD
jgi:hypothetical protein